MCHGKVRPMIQKRSGGCALRAKEDGCCRSRAPARESGEPDSLFLYRKLLPIKEKPSGQDRTAAERNYIAEAIRRRRRILQSRILSCLIGNTLSFPIIPNNPLTSVLFNLILYLFKQYSIRRDGGIVEIFINNHASIPIYEQISSQIKAMIINGDLKAGEALPSIRGLAKSLHISVLTVQKSYDVLQKDGFIETTAGKGCFVSVQNQDFYLEEQQKKIENYFTEAIEIAKVSGIKLDKLQALLALLYEEE